jgi:prepilin-type N-terminal cleavage/methylation domain-containing protein
MFRVTSKSNSRRRTGERGFSVIEMSVVLLIMAVIAAFVVPQVIAYMRKYRLGVGGRNVATALQRARYLATSNNTRAGIVVSESHQLDIRQFSPLGEGEPEDKGVLRLPDDVTIAEDAPREIAFDGRGLVTPLPTESRDIRVNGPDSYYLVVSVSPTGQVTISDTLRDDGI